MFKEHLKLKKLWNKMKKKASIKESKNILTFDNRRKETKEFTKEFYNVILSQLDKLNKKEFEKNTKNLLKLAGIKDKGR